MTQKRRKQLCIARFCFIVCTMVIMGFVWLTASIFDVWVHSYNGSENQWNMFIVTDCRGR